MKRFKKRPSPAMIVAISALFISLVGTAFAGSIAEISLNRGEKKQIRKITRKVSNRVANRRITKRAPGLNVAAAQNANVANVANVADLSHNATKAGQADDSQKLGGDDADDFVQKTAQSGEVLTGQLAEYYEGAGAGFFVAGGSYRSPLPAGVGTPTLVYTTSTTPQCSGFGQASPGVLCVYGYNTSNIDNVFKSGAFSDPNKRYGFSLDVFVEVAASNGYLLANWAYEVP